MFNKPTDTQIAAIRAFNRFYTHKLGVLDQQLMESPFSLSEARVLYELAQEPVGGSDLSAKVIGQTLGLDAGYLSRMLHSFDDKGLLKRTPLASDRRQQRLSLTAKGRHAFAELDQRSQSEISAMLATVGASERASLVLAMRHIEDALGPTKTPPSSFVLRSHRPGDIGWVISRHGATYAQEFGWDISFEALVAQIAAQFITSFDPACEHCWIAEIDGNQVGSVFLVKTSNEVAKLRMLLVDQKARGLGVGRALTEQCIRFAREKNYKRIVLWTQSILVAAREIYQRAGFRLTAAEPNHRFGVDLVSETWELEL